MVCAGSIRDSAHTAGPQLPWNSTLEGRLLASGGTCPWGGCRSTGQCPVPQAHHLLDDGHFDKEHFVHSDPACMDGSVRHRAADWRKISNKGARKKGAGQGKSNPWRGKGGGASDRKCPIPPSTMLTATTTAVTPYSKARDTDSPSNCSTNGRGHGEITVTQQPAMLNPTSCRSTPPPL